MSLLIFFAVVLPTAGAAVAIGETTRNDRTRRRCEYTLAALLFLLLIAPIGGTAS